MSLFKNKNILIIGDVMLDSYIFGRVDRISQEAPVPIVNPTRREDKLGGAANVAANIKSLGGNPILCSIVGDDDNYKVFISELEKMDIKSDFILQSNNRKTTNKLRIIGNNHQMLRIDDEITSNINLEEKDNLLSLIDNILNTKNIDCIILQDYDKGILNEISIPEIISKGNSLNIPIVVDPKKKNFYNYNNITLFKPNFKEFKDSVDLNFDNKIEFLKNGAIQLHEKGIKIILTTLSEDGMFLSYINNGNVVNKIIPGIPRNVSDVSGAGDTVISVVSMLINDMDIEKVVKVANISGGIVCEELGVVPINTEKLLQELLK